MKSAVKADLHLHTTYSDGVSRPEDYLRVAKKKNFSVISVTDHNTFRGSEEAVRLSKQYDIIVVPGCEVRTEIGDILVYCEELPSEEAPRRFAELVKWKNDNRCILVPAHPLDILRSGVGLLRLIRLRWDAVEAYNGGTMLPLVNELTYVVAKALRRPAIGSSDAHSILMFGMCYTEIQDEITSPREVLMTIISGKISPRKASSHADRVKAKIATRALRKVYACLDKAQISSEIRQCV